MTAVATRTGVLTPQRPAQTETPLARTTRLAPIVAAVDGSAAGTVAAEAAVRLAARMDAPLVFVYVRRRPAGCPVPAHIPMVRGIHGHFKPPVGPVWVGNAGPGAILARSLVGDLPLDQVRLDDGLALVARHAEGLDLARAEARLDGASLMNQGPTAEQLDPRHRGRERSAGSSGLPAAR